MTGYRGKRLLDLTLAVPAFVISLPLQALVALAIRLRLGRPVLFRQTRPGLNAEPFELVKFRSMLTPEQVGNVTADSPRLTGFGRLLRSTSVDELPTLWNVVRGDMSLVGPRPLLVEYLDLYSPDQARRHEVRPGLTGLAQTSGRNRVDWDERFRLDVEYIERQSFALDVRIIFKTIRAVVSRHGITESGHVTMTEFRGSATHGSPS
jgi:lipopolysaccharide/colanic/teichoic acid biosynthesis glycosyltransferase